MADKGALKPEIFNIPHFIEQKKTDIEVLTQDEKILAAGADNAFWRTLKKYFDESLAQLDSINDAAIAEGLPMEEIGRNAIVISQVKGVLNKISNVVQDAKEAQNGRGEEK